MEASLYDADADGVVHCRLCRHRCRIEPGRRGICRVRENRGGVLETLVYGRLVARSVDPIEKKPLFHVLPGSRSYSIATVGCNFRCDFCQNADIAQPSDALTRRTAGGRVDPAAVAADALDHGCQTIAYTYTEPTVFFEFARDTARLAACQGLRNLFVTNGYMSEAALDEIAPDLHAANVDLKAFSEDFYRTHCGGTLRGVTDSLHAMRRGGIFLEVTTLLIPGLNDDAAELADLAAFVATELGPATPWHVSRFHPTYRMLDRPPTPVESVRKARRIGLEAGLKYVYTGNAPGDDGENTYCPSCGLLLVERRGFSSRNRALDDGRCSGCGASIDGVGWNRKAGF